MRLFHEREDVKYSVFKEQFTLQNVEKWKILFGDLYSVHRIILHESTD